jgi:hypothetical protein
MSIARESSVDKKAVNPKPQSNPDPEPKKPMINGGIV